MAKRLQVWYFRNSAAAKLVAPLRSQYTLRALPAAGKAKGEAGPEGWRRGMAPPQDGAAVVFLADLEKDDVAAVQELVGGSVSIRLIGLLSPSGKTHKRSTKAATTPVFAYLPRRAPREIVARTVSAAFENLELAERVLATQAELHRTELEMEELNRIGVALSSQRDINELLSMILLKSREVTRADAASLYLIEEVNETERRMRFKLTQNDSVQFPFAESTMPITERSMAGYVALHGEVINLPDAYRIPADRPYHFNPKFDQDSGYLTRSMLTLPMKNAKGEILGVLQLLNSKRDWTAKLTHRAAVDKEVVPFSLRAERLALSLASQAAVAYENSKLYEDIETLFEGFVKAAVTAIEQRDPTTSGHSFRVSTLTVGLAGTVDRAESGPFSDVKFTREEMKEIRYAALLHDFGKVGVREQVLVKAKKLYPLQLDLIRQRFDYIRKELESRISRQKLKILLEGSREQALTEIGLLEQEYERQLAEVDDYFQFILQVNEPTVLPAGKFDHLITIAKQRYVDPRGIEQTFLSPEEVRYLSIPKGSLDESERVEIESHVIHTFNFLAQIPWTKEIKAIPLIARAHHEKLNGSGYPYKLKSGEIPLQSKMMTVCDMFDALSASDRPYKKAVPIERALDILKMCVRDNELDPVLLDLFLEAKIYQLTMKT